MSEAVLVTEAALGADAALADECRVFTRLLSGAPASRYVVDRYVRAHRVSPSLRPATRFDRWLVAAAGWSTLLARLADGYARLLAPRSALRSKLVLLLAILESCAPYHRLLEPNRPVPAARVVLGLAGAGIAGAAVALAGIALFLPLRLAAALLGGGR